MNPGSNAAGCFGSPQAPTLGGGERSGEWPGEWPGEQEVYGSYTRNELPLYVNLFPITI